MSALLVPYLDEEEWQLPSCLSCGETVIRADVCLRCGYCQLCNEYADDCTCIYRAEDRYIDFEAQEYEDARLGA
jgi:ribosomal protein L32